MAAVLITGSSGLVGSSSVNFFCEMGFDVIGIDNNRRNFFFGPAASTLPIKKKLENKFRNFKSYSVDIRDQNGIFKIFNKYKTNIKLVIHAAAQPSHDWASSNLNEDFTINANGTLNVLEATRQFSKNAVFIHLSTNKVYGDFPNSLKYARGKKRLNPTDKKLRKFGFDEMTPIDKQLHSFFGVSKAAGDLLAQEYGKNFGMKTTILRGGCLTGSDHAGVKAHGFLSYLVKSLKLKKKYQLIGYEGKQVRDNIDCRDLANAFFHIFKSPTYGEVFNIGGGIYSNCSILEAINFFEEISNQKVNYEFIKKPRVGDHMWWISDLRKFKKYYPKWKINYNTKQIIEEIYNS